MRARCQEMSVSCYNQLLAILDNLEKIRYRLRSAAQRAGRDPDEVTLVVVTKYAPLEAVRDVLKSGLVSEIGESRVQDAQAKKAALGELSGRVRWRLIGHLQTNKARKAVETFDAVDCVDSERLAEALDRAAEGRKDPLPVLVQVKLTEKQTQAGVPPENLDSLLAALARFKRLAPRGLMGIAPMVEPVEAVRPHFKRLKALFDAHFAGRPGAQLSMGMSRDFEVAVEEGATHVRVGSQIFQP